MSEDDIRTIARIVQNQNCALLEARIAALRAERDLYLKPEIAREIDITERQLDAYHRDITAAAKRL